MDARLEGLATLLKQKTEKTAEEAKYKSFIDGDKVMLRVTKKGVVASVVEQKTQKKRKVSTLTDAEKAQMKEAKKLLEGNANLLNLAYLLIRVKEEIRKINFKSISSDKLDMVRKLAVDIKDAGLFQKALGDQR